MANVKLRKGAATKYVNALVAPEWKAAGWQEVSTEDVTPAKTAKPAAQAESKKAAGK